MHSHLSLLFAVGKTRRRRRAITIIIVIMIGPS
jgi:hypothetical protein